MNEKTLSWTLPIELSDSFLRVAELTETDPNDLLKKVVEEYISRVYDLRSEIQKGVDSANEGRFVRIKNEDDLNELRRRIFKTGASSHKQ